MSDLYAGAFFSEHAEDLTYDRQQLFWKKQAVDVEF